MGHRTKRFFQWSGKMGERLWKPNGLGMFGKMGWIFRSGFFLYMGLHLLYVWGAFLRIFGRLLYIGLADGVKTAWKGFILGCVAVLWLGWWILLYDDVNGCVAVFFCAYFQIWCLKILPNRHYLVYLQHNRNEYGKSDSCAFAA